VPCAAGVHAAGGPLLRAVSGLRRWGSVSGLEVALCSWAAAARLGRSHVSVAERKGCVAVCCQMQLALNCRNTNWDRRARSGAGLGFGVILKVKRVLQKWR